MKMMAILLAVLGGASQLSGAERLSVLSPHRKSLQREYIPAFEEHYRKTYGQEIEVEWIDQGGTENDLRYIRNKYSLNPESSGIDVFWGGGDLTFEELDERGLLMPVRLPANLMGQLQEEIAGVTAISKNGTWYATALSSFGIFYNKFLQKKLKLPEPQSWESLADPAYLGHLSVADPRHSSSSLTMYLIMLYSDNWEKSWQTISALSANVREFSLSSSQPIKDVVAGDATFATAIDFYATAKIAALGKERLGFVLPPEKTVFNADPVGILKGAPHKIQAERFVNYLLSATAQKKLILPVGKPEGPEWSTLGRMAVNKLAYQNTSELMVSQNPFLMAKPKFTLEPAIMARVKSVLKDLIGAVYIDLHPHLRKAWKAATAPDAPKSALAKIQAPPLSPQELELFSGKWEDQTFRNQVINRWISTYKKVYTELAVSDSKAGT